MLRLSKLSKSWVLLFIIFVGGFFLFQFTQKPVLIQAQPIELAPNYLVYSEKILKASQDQGRVVLYFWAPWCATCAVLDSDLKDNKAQLPEDITILRINYDEEVELKKKYNVVIQHTFVEIDKEGKVLNRWVGGGVKDIEQYLN